MTDDSKTAGATAGDDESGLIQPQLADKRARDAAELEAIDRAYEKHVHRARRKAADGTWLTEEFIRRVHLDMFGEIWDWAGKYRTGNVNMGVDWHKVPEQVKVLCGDFVFWNSPKASMPILEIAARLQNRLTKVHPFKNGNGRHARLMTDIFFRSRKNPLPQWPQIQRMERGDDVRKRYIKSMKSADQENYRELIQFIKECSNEREGNGER